MLFLASSSPRRKQILEAAAIPHLVRAADIDEVRLPGEEGLAFVERMAIEKAHAITPDKSSDIVLAADTMVFLDDQVFGKPADDAEVARMLKMLSGRTHNVVTGICLRHPGGLTTEVCTTRLQLTPLSDDEIADYTQSGEGRDKAGAYSIQGRGSRFVRCIEGCYYNVVGLPLSAVYRHLRTLNYL